MSSGYSVIFEDAMCIVTDKKSDNIIARIPMTHNRMFPLDVITDVSSALTVKGDNETRLWHMRFGHLNVKSLRVLTNNEMVIGLPKIGEHAFCEGCVYGKQRRLPFPSGQSWRASNFLDLVHADLCGPMRTESIGGSRYFLLLTDDFTRMSWVYFLAFKSEAFNEFKKFKVLVENQSGRTIKALRTDRGGEFISNEFNEFCADHGIRRELTAPYTPQQNGVAECKNRTVVEMARSMLKAKGLPNKF